MQFVEQLLQFLQQGLAAIFRFVQTIWEWSVEQIAAVPWDAVGDLPLWKFILLLICAAFVLWWLYRAGIELMEAGEKALIALAELLRCFVRTLPPILLAGVAAAGTAWVITHVNF